MLTRLTVWGLYQRLTARARVCVCVRAQVAGTASAGVAHLLTLGKSVGAHLFGEPATEHWPAGATSKATALRFVAHQLEADIAAVSAAFGKSLAEADEALMTPFREEAATGGKPQLVLDLEADAAAAAHKLREAFRFGEHVEFPMPKS